MRKALWAPFVVAVSLAAPAAFAGAHTWDIWEVFSNADGTVQYVEMLDPSGSAETFIGGHQIRGNPSGTLYTILNNLSGNTNMRFWLVATPAFAALPGAPTPDEIKQPGFLFALTDTSVAYVGTDTMTWAAGALPLDGIRSLQRPGVGQTPVSTVNSPTNFAGGTGSVNVIPGVQTLTVGKNAPDGSSLSISFNASACAAGYDHQILYGQKSGLPATLGGTFAPLGGACNIGTVSPYTWTPTPDAADGSGLVWFLVVKENNAGKEGPWGRQTGNVERSGPGTNGASNVCAVTAKDTNSTCGN